MTPSANQTKHAFRAETAVPKVLLYDIETSPIVGFTFGPLWDARIAEVIEESMIISVAWKWVGEKEVGVLALPDFKSYAKKPRCNKALIRALHKLISRADIAVGHNIDRFDDKIANTDMVVLGFNPPPPHKSVDTLKVAKTKFRFSSNRLGDLGRRLGFGGKVEHEGFPLWRKCRDGDLKAWGRMRRYNQGDVRLLEKIYRRFRPWMTNHPSMTSLDNHPGCPLCRAPAIRMKVNKKYRMVGVSKKIQFACQDCGKFSTAESRPGGWFFK